jgi:hypothetical protein
MRRPTSRIVLALATAALVVPFAASCMGSGDEGHRAGDPGSLLQPTQPPEVEAEQLAATPQGKLLPLRQGEQRMTLTMPETYTPSAPMASGMTGTLPTRGRTTILALVSALALVLAGCGTNGDHSDHAAARDDCYDTPGQP